MKSTDQYKQKLEEEQKMLLSQLESEGALLNPETGLWDARPLEGMAEADENDRADRAEDYEEKTGLVRTLTSRLKDIQDALQKIKDNAYGTCEIGGEKIEEERLEANPAARTCMKHI
jgi:RNA polymerase-binding transcription factor DksA